jgi:hypothetical protein
MAFTLKVNGTAHSEVVNPDTIAAQVEAGALRSHGCAVRREYAQGWTRGARHPHPADRFQPAAILSDLLDERTAC